MTRNLIDAFQEFFELVPASTEELKQAVYKLRYQVYCLETGFENPHHYPNGIEKDEYDDHSAHYLIRHKLSGSYAATTRLVLPNREHSNVPLPIEVHCQINHHERMGQIPKQDIAEVSRFCVSKDFKKRRGEAGTITGISENGEDYFSNDERRVFPHITLALIACLIKMSREYGISHWYAVMEPALLRFLKRLGIYFTEIGPLTEYHGLRQPCIAKVEDILSGAYEKNKQVWEMFTNRSAL